MFTFKIFKGCMCTQMVTHYNPLMIIPHSQKHTRTPTQPKRTQKHTRTAKTHPHTHTAKNTTTLLHTHLLVNIPQIIRVGAERSESPAS